MRELVISLCVASLTFGGLPVGAVAQPDVAGSIAGKIVDRETGSTVSGVTVKAHVITENRRLPEIATGADGTFFLSDAPSGVYAFTLSYEGKDYRVRDRLDARAGISFLLESCFVLDRSNETAAVSREPCRTGLVPEAQIVALGAHRFFDPTPDIREAPGQGAQAGPDISHDGIECFPREHFPIVDADVVPGPQVQVARVYFRAAQHEDFYYVDMNVADLTDPDRFESILPRAAPETQEVIYYVEALNDELLSSRTADFASEVVDDDACRRRDPGAAWFAGQNPGIIVGSNVVGAASAPPGFLAAGIAGFINAAGVYTAMGAGAAAAGGGLGTTGLILIIGGAAAATTGGIILAADDEPTDQREASPPR